MKVTSHSSPADPRARRGDAAHFNLLCHLAQHPKCTGKGCQERDNVDGDGLCTHTASTLDDLPIRCVGQWAYEKIYRLVQYFGIFANGIQMS